MFTALSNGSDLQRDGIGFHCDFRYELAMAMDSNGDHEVSEAEVHTNFGVITGSRMMNWAELVHSDISVMYASMAQRLKRVMHPRDEL